MNQLANDAADVFGLGATYADPVADRHVLGGAEPFSVWVLAAFRRQVCPGIYIPLQPHIGFPVGARPVSSAK